MRRGCENSLAPHLLPKSLDALLRFTHSLLGHLLQHPQGSAWFCLAATAVSSTAGVSLPYLSLDSCLLSQYSCLLSGLGCQLSCSFSGLAADQHLCCLLGLLLYFAQPVHCAAVRCVLARAAGAEDLQSMCFVSDSALLQKTSSRACVGLVADLSTDPDLLRVSPRDGQLHWRQTVSTLVRGLAGAAAGWMAVACTDRLRSWKLPHTECHTRMQSLQPVAYSAFHFEYYVAAHIKWTWLQGCIP